MACGTPLTSPLLDERIPSKDLSSKLAARLQFWIMADDDQEQKETGDGPK
jgi:hypothetical protein